MSERYYTAMVRHVLRYYCKNLSGPSRDKDTWYAADRVLTRLSDSDRDTVVNIYQGGETVVGAIQRLSREHRTDPKRLWDLVNFVERSIAKEMKYL